MLTEILWHARAYRSPNPGATVRGAQTERERRAAVNLAAVKEELKHQASELSASGKWARSASTLKQVDALLQQSNSERQQWRDYMAARVHH
jgi:hypothetical protein